SIEGNAATSYGGGIHVTGPTASPAIANSILWNNSAGASGDEISLAVNATLTISYSDVEGGEAGAYNDGSATLNWGTGNSDLEPFFVSAPSDYHLRYDSPAIDAGDPASAYANEPAPNGGRVNMGAYGNTPEATSFLSLDSYSGYFAVFDDINGGGINELAVMGLRSSHGRAQRRRLPEYRAGDGSARPGT
ncbi:MAG: hypothetical protein V3R90_00585, partial [Limibaculum sp.]